MDIYLEGKDQHLKMDFTGTGLELLRKLKINPVTIVFVRNSKLVPEEVELENTDKIEILEVVSGG